MSILAPFHLDANGIMAVCGDGPELLVFSGDNKPAFKAFCNGILVGVGVADDRVIAADSDGAMTWWRTFDGEVLETCQAMGSLKGMEVHPSGKCAVWTDHDVQLFHRGNQVGSTSTRGPTAVAFDDSGAGMAIGNAKGELLVLVPEAEGVAAPLVLFPGAPNALPVNSVAWSRVGHWVVCVGGALVLVDRLGTAVIGELARVNEPGSHVTVSADGVLVAVVYSDRRVDVYDMTSRRKVGDVVFRRDVCGLQFGPGALLGVGLDDGDFNRIDLLSGAASRSEPHHGRARNNWNFESSMDYSAIRGAVVSNRAGGQAIAKFVYDEDMEPKRSKGFYVGVGCAVLTFSCAGCGILGFILRYFGYM